MTALTGVPMDRLAEERRRGITIELGFTSIELDGVRAGIVDVPGHEDFIRTMVAGASGVDVALLVIAADDGIMPQGREHLTVIEQLGVPFVLPVITKADLVDAQWLKLVTADIDAWLRGSPTTVLDLVVTSVRDGRGLEELRDVLAALSPRIPSRDARDAFRMPIDRAFLVAGTGVVVTGTPSTGSIKAGDELELHPGMLRVRVRGVEVHGMPREVTAPGQRTALALAGVDLSEVARGSTLVEPGRGWAPTSRIMVRVGPARDATERVALRSVRISLGTSDVIAHPSSGELSLGPGEHRVVPLRLSGEILARGGDRLVLRETSSGRVLGGGVVLDPLAPSRPQASSSDGSLASLAGSRRWGLTRADAVIAAGVPTWRVDAELGASGLVQLGARWLTRERVASLEARLARIVAASHAAAPMERGIPKATALARLGGPDDVAGALLARLSDAGQLVHDRGVVALPGFHPTAGPDSARVNALLHEIRQDALGPRRAAELPGEPAMRDRALRELVKDGRIVPVTPDRFVSADLLAGFRAILEEVGRGGPITPAAVRDATGLSRKHLIPLLEWADRAGLTVQAGEARILASRPA